MMILEFIKAFGKENIFDRASVVLTALKDITECFEEEYLKDKNAKNAAIDSIIKILEEYKDKP